MQFMLADNMERTEECQQMEVAENKTETSENASDRESSIESFHTNKSELSIATETELINVDDIELSDEESWLYKSPKKLPSEEKSVNTQKWLQKNVDDMNDVELKATRTALLSKLNQLKLLNPSLDEKEIKDLRRSSVVSDPKVQEKEIEDLKKSCITSCGNRKGMNLTVSTSTLESSHDVSKTDGNISDEENKKTKTEKDTWKSNDVFNVADIQKIARLQEESLKQSTYKFLSHSGKKAQSSRDLSPISPAQIVGLNKPASVEALNMCVDKPNHSNVYSMVPLQGMKKQSLFCSSSALNSNQELHRGSLPNINKGYYSLKSKKSKRPSDPKVSCPLPIYPTHLKASLNGTVPQPSGNLQTRSASASYDHRETRTLPSSYRVHSRSNSSSRRDLSVLSPPRRESVPLLGSNLPLESNQRNHRKFSSPVPSAIYPRSNSSTSVVSPTKAYNSQTQSLRSPPGLEYHRAASHSPSRRLPLSTVQHQSPKKGNNLVSPRNGEIRTLKMPSKIPSPASRSGIPVPSSAYMSRANDDDTWSQDCF